MPSSATCDRSADQPGRVGGLAVPAPLRLPGMLRRPARRRPARALEHRPGPPRPGAVDELRPPLRPAGPRPGTARPAVTRRPGPRPGQAARPPDGGRGHHGHPALPGRHADPRDRLGHAYLVRSGSPTSCRPATASRPPWCASWRAWPGSVDVSCVLRIRFGYGQVVPTQVGGPLPAGHRRGRRPLAGHADHADRPRDGPTMPPSRVNARRACPVRADLVAVARARAGAARPAAGGGGYPEAWGEWVARCTDQGTYREAVVRSLITLKALTYEPTGGIVAAATTSLPEDLGGVRNWDYRYCWLRDATITLEALLRSGYRPTRLPGGPGWCAPWRATRATLQIMYGVAGERRLDEWEIDWLPGYENSAPVRVGNAAVDQLPARRVRRGHPTPPSAARPASPGPARLGACRRGCGLRGEPLGRPRRGHLGGPRPAAGTSCTPRSWRGWPSTGRCGVERIGLAGPADHGAPLRDKSTSEVCEKGYDAARGAFTQYYGSKNSTPRCCSSRVGFLPRDHDRRARDGQGRSSGSSRDDGFVTRYSTSDGRQRRRPTRRRGCVFGLHASGWRTTRRSPAAWTGATTAVRAAAGPAQRRRATRRGIRSPPRAPGGQHPQAFSRVAAHPGRAEPGPAPRCAWPGRRARTRRDAQRHGKR